MTGADRRGRWEALATQLRIDVVRACAAAGSGHPTSSLSCTDLVAVLVADFLRFDLDDPARPDNDALIFSKGHASALLYAVHKALGAIDDEELLTYRRCGSRLEGHPKPVLPLIEVATGSLGQGLPIGVGVALAASRLAGTDARTYVLCGDGEMGEGSMWEAIAHAAAYELAGLVAIVDVNGLAQDGPVFGGVDADALCARVASFGWRTLAVDGHDVAAIAAAYELAAEPDGRPTLIAARTVKGRGVEAAEGRTDLHGKRLAGDASAVAGRRDADAGRVTLRRPSGPAPTPAPAVSTAVRPPRYPLGATVDVRRAYGETLSRLLASDERVVVLDAGVATSTFGGATPEAERRFLPVDIAEQQLVAAAVGLQARGWRPYVSTFAAFLGRATDFVRMASFGGAAFVVCGSHGGVSVGEDGPSQMGLEDVAAMRAIAGSTVVCPSDANQMAALLTALAELPGVRYVRSTRPALPVIHDPDRAFPVGGSALVRDSPDDEVLLVAAGIAVHESLRAADLLAADGIAARVLDAYSIKPLDAPSIVRHARACGGRIVTVEDHRPEGGLGEAVALELLRADATCRLTALAVHGVPGSGTAAELLAAAAIDAPHVASAARALVADAAAAR